MTSNEPETTWVRIGAGRVIHILGAYGTAARSTSKCGKTGKVTIIPEPRPAAGLRQLHEHSPHSLS